MTTNPRTPSAKRIRIEGETYDSDEDSLICEDYSSAELGSEIGVDMLSNSSIMDISDGSNDPAIFVAKDGTKWKEFFPDDVPRDQFSPKIIDHIPKISDRCQNVESLTGN